MLCVCVLRVLRAARVCFFVLSNLPPPHPKTTTSTPQKDSAKGFPASAEGSYEAGLNVGKGKRIDASIHRAYVSAVRHAQRFLYIENQVCAMGGGCFVMSFHCVFWKQGVIWGKEAVCVMTAGAALSARAT